MKNSKVRQIRDSEPTRSDSTQNKETLVLAALQLFSIKGPEVPLAEIAKQAGVSRMTFYRNFPDRQAIVAAVFHHNLDKLGELAQQFEDDEQGFYKLLKIVLQQRVEYHLYVPYLDDKEILLTSKKLSQLFKGLILKAQEANLLRKDFDIDKDLLLLIAMMGGAVSYPKMPNGINAERTMELILNGLKG